jgi:hypothetical protein
MRGDFSLNRRIFGGLRAIRKKFANHCLESNLEG